MMLYITKSVLKVVLQPFTRNMSFDIHSFSICFVFLFQIRKKAVILSARKWSKVVREPSLRRAQVMIAFSKRKKTLEQNITPALQIENLNESSLRKTVFLDKKPACYRV